MSVQGVCVCEATFEAVWTIIGFFAAWLKQCTESQLKQCRLERITLEGIDGAWHKSVGPAFVRRVAAYPAVFCHASAFVKRTGLARRIPPTPSAQLSYAYSTVAKDIGSALHKAQCKTSCCTSAKQLNSPWRLGKLIVFTKPSIHRLPSCPRAAVAPVDKEVQWAAEEEEKSLIMRCI